MLSTLPGTMNVRAGGGLPIGNAKKKRQASCRGPNLFGNDDDNRRSTWVDLQPYFKQPRRGGGGFRREKASISTLHRSRRYIRKPCKVIHSGRSTCYSVGAGGDSGTSHDAATKWGEMKFVRFTVTRQAPGRRRHPAHSRSTHPPTRHTLSSTHHSHHLPPPTTSKRENQNSNRSAIPSPPLPQQQQQSTTPNLRHHLAHIENKR